MTSLKNRVLLFAVFCAAVSSICVSLGALSLSMPTGGMPRVEIGYQHNLQVQGTLNPRVDPTVHVTARCGSTPGYGYEVQDDYDVNEMTLEFSGSLGDGNWDYSETYTCTATATEAGSQREFDVGTDP